MYIMYVDESGDTGLANSPTRYFCLSGLVVHESNWRDFLNALIAFRKTIRSVYGMPVRDEIHASEMVSRRRINRPRFESSQPGPPRGVARGLATIYLLDLPIVAVGPEGRLDHFDVHPESVT